MSPARDQLSSLDILRVAKALGLEVRRNGSADYCACPASEPRGHPQPNYCEDLVF